MASVNQFEKTRHFQRHCKYEAYKNKHKKKPNNIGYNNSIDRWPANIDWAHHRLWVTYALKIKKQAILEQQHAVNCYTCDQQWYYQI